MTPEQFRAARAVLRLTMPEVCGDMQASQATLVNLEKGRDVRMATVRKLREYYEAKGVAFDENGRGVTWAAPVGAGRP